LRRGLKNYGNAYHVANSVWRSIHNPVSEEMITTGTGIPEVSDDENVYYDRSGTTNTRALRDFHNLYVKRKLITSVSSRGDTLIDLAVGKGGDLSKWIAAKLKFVFGVDVSADNINNRMDGACARYLNYRKQYKYMPKALFVVGDSGLPLKTGEALKTEKSKEITQAIFGIGAKDRKRLGEGVYKQFGVGSEGFNVVSCQFAFHYFFNTPETLTNFLRNVTDSCALNGYFIGTCYDGKSIFRLLDTKKQGESIVNYIGGRKMWEIKKMYDSVEFNDDESSLGYAIDVYQESINKTFREYLVNFDFVIKMMRNYGFELITDTEAKTMNLPRGSGTFDMLYNYMKSEVEKEKHSRKKHKLVDEIGTALDLEDSLEQKQVSFLNRYFVFKKVVDLDGSKVVASPLDVAQEKAEEEESKIAEKVAEETVKSSKKPKRTKKKLVLKKKPKA
jgi:ubiquinone/menaquinone biosynthesis C-methylase UbiE